MGLRMKKRWVVLLVFLAIGFGLDTVRAQMSANTPTVLKLDPALDEIISTDAKLETVKGDFFLFTEGPTWVPQGKNSGYLVFSEMAANEILKMTMDGQISVYLDHSG